MLFFKNNDSDNDNKRPMKAKVFPRDVKRKKLSAPAKFTPGEPTNSTTALATSWYKQAP
jgi:hypothetical protein